MKNTNFWDSPLIVYHLGSVNYFTLNKVLVSRAQLLHRFFQELQSLQPFETAFIVMFILQMENWILRWHIDISSQLYGLLWLSLVSYCSFWFWAPRALRLKIVPVITTDILTGVKLIVKSGTFKTFLHLALISDSFSVTFQMSDVSL